MNNITTVKLALAAIAVILFAAGVRMNSTALRWAAIGFLIAAFLLRFVKKDRAP